MINLEAVTTLSAEKAVARLKDFFGSNGLGLVLAEDTADCLRFDGGGGYVSASVCPEKKGARIRLITQEWEYQARKFISELP
jgi:hypothetical protein